MIDPTQPPTASGSRSTDRWMTGRNGWIIFLSTAALIDGFWPSDQLLSTAFDRFRTRHPIWAWYFILATANHFLRISPPRWDIYQIVYWLRPLRHTVKRVRGDADDWLAVDL